MGNITVAIAYYADREILFPVSKGSFIPAPKVESSVIKLNVLDSPAVSVKKEENFFRVVKASFAQRRKTIINTLSASLGLSKDETRDILEKAEVDSKMRAEQMKLEDFANIANQL